MFYSPQGEMQPREDHMRWIPWALGEAVFRATSVTLIKIIGELSQTLAHVTLSTLVIGLVQSVVAGSMLVRNRTFSTTRRFFIGSVLFGVGAFFSSIVAFVAYMQGANMAVYTLLTLLAIVPGALIDRIWFGERLVARQMLGIALAILAGWLALKVPTVAELAGLPLWTWLGLLNAVGLAVNQGCTRWIKDVDPWVKNFWGGLTTLLLGVMVLVFLGMDRALLSGPDIRPLLLWSTLIAFAVIGIWSFSVIAYRDGAAIPTKHVLVNGVFLALVLAVGFLVFNEEIAPVQVGGMLVYLCAFVLINNEVWRFVAVRR